MKVIDNILLEWSYRCPDGIVDLNNPEKAKILFEILNEIDSKQELIDLINTSELSPEQIGKLKKYVAGRVSTSDTNAQLEKKLTEKGLKRLAPLVVYSANNFDVEDKLLAYMQDDTKNPSLSSNTNLFTLFSESGLPEDFLKKLVQTTSNQLGAGELLLITMLKDAKKLQAKSGRGDILVGGKVIELKGNGATISEWGDKAPIRAAFNNIYGPTNEKELKGEGWLTILGDDLASKDKERIEKAKAVLQELYPNFTLNIPQDKEAGDIIKVLKKSIAEGFADQYFNEEKINSILVLNEITGDYRIFNKEGFKNALGSEITYSFAKDTAPRISLSNEQTKVDEGLKFSEDKNKIIVNSHNSEDDLLFLNFKDATIGGVNVYYSMEYNQKNPNAKDIKQLSDNIKQLKVINIEELYNILKSDLEKMFNLNYTPKVVYYLDSSAPLSKMIADVIKENFSDIKVLPLYKIKFPSWEDMLIPDYKSKIKSEDFLARVEKAAQKIWQENEGKIKSSGLNKEIRDYFKPKYDLDKIIEDKHMMFIDDNVQTGTDFKTISNKFFNNSSILFYAAIRLNIAGSTSTQASRNAKAVKIPFEFKYDDLKKFSNNVGVKSTYSDISKLISKGYVKKDTIKLGGTTYYVFANTDITLDDLLNK
jgi:hypothetical protein